MGLVWEVNSSRNTMVIGTEVETHRGFQCLSRGAITSFRYVSGQGGVSMGGEFFEKYNGYWHGGLKGCYVKSC